MEGFRAGRRHGAVGWLYVAAGFLLPGALVLFAGLTRSTADTGWFAFPPNVAPWVVRVLAIAVGGGLLAAGWGIARFRRWGWILAILWGAWSLVEVARGVFPEPRAATIPVFELIALLGMPYLWIRRREVFGPGSNGP